MEGKRKLLIALTVVALISVGVYTFVAIKKKNNEGWRLFQLPDGNKKRNKKIILKRTN